MKTWVWLSIIISLVAMIFLLLFVLGKEASLSPDASASMGDEIINGCGWGEDCHYVCSGDTCVMQENRGGASSNFCNPNQDTCKDKIDISGGVSGVLGIGIRKVICVIFPGSGLVICS